MIQECRTLMAIQDIMLRSNLYRSRKKHRKKPPSHNRIDDGIAILFIYE